MQYNLDWGSGPPLHYLLVDRGGASAVVEFVRGLSPASVLPQSCRPETGSSRDRVVLPFAPACRANGTNGETGRDARAAQPPPVAGGDQQASLFMIHDVHAQSRISEST